MGNCYNYTPIPPAEASCIIAHLFVELALPCSCCKREDGVIVIQGKTYDGSTAIVCMYYYPERAMEGKISGDDLSVVMGQANADSPDVGRRTVTFTGFALAGSDAANSTSPHSPIPAALPSRRVR